MMTPLPPAQPGPCEHAFLYLTGFRFVDTTRVCSVPLRHSRFALLNPRRNCAILITACKLKENKESTQSTQPVGSPPKGNGTLKIMADQLELIKKYMIGRFDNAKQIEDEKCAGQQVTPFAIHVNTPLEDYMDNIPEEYDTTKSFHVLEETYKWHPGHRNAMVRPLLLRFDMTANGSIKLTSLAVPDDLDAASVRHDNPMLRFDYHELQQSKTFPISPVYHFAKETQHFTLDVTATPTENVKVRLVEILSENSLQVHERVWKDGKLVFGYYETPVCYERK